MPYDPVFAHFRPPDGSWYRLWITHTPPKTERGHPWHVHASYAKTGTIARWPARTGMNNPTAWQIGTSTGRLRR